jgi:hypothetical protein
VFTLAAAALSPQDRFSIGRTVFLPPVYYVGDELELRIEVQSEEELALTEPSELPAIEWGEIRDIRIVERGREKSVRVILVSFVPGSHVLPAIDLGAVSLSGIEISTSSILAEDDRQPAQAKGQLLLPGTRFYIGFTIGIIVVIPLLFLLFFKWGKEKIVLLIKKYKERQPARNLIKALQQLNEDAADLDGRDFYILLLDEIRVYLTKKIKVDCLSATSGELELVLSAVLPAENQQTALMKIFKQGDLVKFGNTASSLHERRNHINSTFKIVEFLEDREMEHVDA